MYSSACIRPREEVQHRSGHGVRSVEPCVRPREEVEDRSAHGLRGVEPCIPPLVFVRVKKCNIEVNMA